MAHSAVRHGFDIVSEIGVFLSIFPLVAVKAGFGVAIFQRDRSNALTACHHKKAPYHARALWLSLP